MKINPSTGFERYRSMVQSAKSADSAAVKKASAGRSDAPANTDKVMFSENATSRAEMYRLASSISADVDGVANSERLATLQQQVQSGTYRIDTADVASAILGFND